MPFTLICMKRNLILGLLIVAGFPFLNSCKDDEVPVAGIQFELEEQEVTESDGTIESFHPDEIDDGVGRIIEVKMLFDIALAGDVVLEFDIDGTARENASQSEVNDFEIVEESDGVTVSGDQITILKGVSEASFSVRIFEDYLFELDEDSPVNDDDIPYETIELTLESVVSGPGKLGTQLEHVVKILEDDAYVYLEWNPGDQAGTIGDVNMDLFIHIDGDLRAVSRLPNDQVPYEIMLIPGGFEPGTYGMSYVYKSGTSNDVDFFSEIVNYGGTISTTGGQSGVVLTSQATYTLENINAYDDENPVADAIEQSFVKDGLEFVDATDITVPSSGSRQDAKLSKKKSIITRERLLKAHVTVLRR